MAIVLNEVYTLLSDPATRLVYDQDQARSSEFAGYTSRMPPITASWGARSGPLPELQIHKPSSPHAPRMRRPDGGAARDRMAKGMMEQIGREGQRERMAGARRGRKLMWGRDDGMTWARELTWTRLRSKMDLTSKEISPSLPSGPGRPSFVFLSSAPLVRQSAAFLSSGGDRASGHSWRSLRRRRASEYPTGTPVYSLPFPSCCAK
jgi:hypothetical protein